MQQPSSGTTEAFWLLAQNPSRRTVLIIHMYMYISSPVFGRKTPATDKKLVFSWELSRFALHINLDRFWEILEKVWVKFQELGS